MYRISLVSICLFIVVPVAYAEDTNFIMAFNAQWQSGNASNVLVFVDSHVSTNRNAETLFARGVVAASLQEWGRGATNYLGQAIQTVMTNSSYSTERKVRVVELINNTKGYFGSLADDTGEPSNSQPLWNTDNHAVIFNELGEEVPFLNVLQEIIIKK